MGMEGQLQEFLMSLGTFISSYGLWKDIQATHINISWEAWGAYEFERKKSPGLLVLSWI